MNRFDIYTGSADQATPILQINRYRDAAQILRAEGEVVPRHSEFGTGWSVSLCGTLAIEGAANRVADVASNSGLHVIAGYRAGKLASALMHAIPEAS